MRPASSSPAAEALLNPHTGPGSTSRPRTSTSVKGADAWQVRILEQGAAVAGGERRHVDGGLPAAVRQLVSGAARDVQRLPGAERVRAVIGTELAFSLQHVHDLLGRGVPVHRVRLARLDVDDAEALRTPVGDRIVDDPLER